MAASANASSLGRAACVILCHGPPGAGLYHPSDLILVTICVLWLARDPHGGAQPITLDDDSVMIRNRCRPWSRWRIFALTLAAWLPAKTNGRLEWAVGPTCCGVARISAIDSPPSAYWQDSEPLAETEGGREGGRKEGRKV